MIISFSPLPMARVKEGISTVLRRDQNKTYSFARSFPAGSRGKSYKSLCFLS
ncbi:MAG: hypothetical protein LBR79_02385 [Oscillospiraceae bacterium]|nr:hypothetical protein [Oscillospiraceae bacterium]